jgi:hypothetical protein
MAADLTLVSVEAELLKLGESEKEAGSEGGGRKIGKKGMREGRGSEVLQP